MAERLTRSRVEVEQLISQAIAVGKDFQSKLTERSGDEQLKMLEAWDNNVKTLLADVFTGPDPAAAYPAALIEQIFPG